MSEERNYEVSCDGCGRDITYGLGYRVLLRDQDLASEGGAVSDFVPAPIVGDDKHFCDFRCLREWLDKASGPSGRSPGSRVTTPDSPTEGARIGGDS